ncbi:uncharacterized protein SRS1_15405 [Sporisorium reilianum f. sp. reilianum]|uniref:Uncharacterized protein n=1 Tax=Sporisorium reilianum f. sp. reilianum TaxID=72559 RepID=A0A2N8UII6_9BASI|nr:uncharacterized protein SRS1_15405 [Sporisorium reilianum f. sp. reilianum]
MLHWRSSLAVLRRIGSVDTQARGSNSVLGASVIPDFLAPSLQRASGPAARRHTASLARVAFEHTAIDPSHDSAGTSKATHDLRSDSSKNKARRIDFSSYFDADVPLPSSSSSTRTDSTSVHPRCSDTQGAAYIQMRFDAATDATDLTRLAREFYCSSALLSERKSVNSVHTDHARQTDKPTTTLQLNETLLLSLAQACRAPSHSGKSDPGLMDQLVAKYLRRVCKDVSIHGFSDSFLSRLAHEAREQSHNADSTVLPLLFDIIEQRLSHPEVENASRDADGTTATLLSKGRARAASQTLLTLMQSCSHIGRSHIVRSCFGLLKRHSLPVTVYHYQFQLIALFRERSCDLAGKDQADIERESHQIQTDILRINTMMEADNITLDDTALATIVNGLSAPLRNPLASVSSVAQANSALELARTIYEQSASRAQDDAFAGLPRMSSSLLNAEIDAIERDASLTAKARAKASKRVQGLIHRLEARAALSNSPGVGSLGRRPVSETQLACIYLHLRLQAVLGDADLGMEHLRLLLSVQPVAESQKRELILKQRSGVIRLFSAVLQRRSSIAGQDAAFDVLLCAFSAEWFDRVWSGVALPSNLGAGLDLEAYHPEASVLRLWTKWLHAWSADYLAEGIKRRDFRQKYRTFTGSYPWQTLKRGLKLLNKVIDQYEALDAPHRKSTSDGVDQDPKPSPRIAAFASIFTDRILLDNMVKLCLRGGRPAANETMATHVERRLTLLIRTLTRVYVPARTWEHVESSMLRHLALIPREVMPTSAVQDAMHHIENRKHLALLRNPDLVKALDESVGSAAPETGSIFVLRQMLRQRAVQQSLNAAAP